MSYSIVAIGTSWGGLVAMTKLLGERKAAIIGDGLMALKEQQLQRAGGP